MFRWTRVSQYLHFWLTIPLRTDQIVKTSTLCSNSTAHCLEFKNNLRGNGPSARSQFSFTDYHLPLMSHLPLCKTNTLLTIMRVNCQCTDTRALLVLQKTASTGSVSLQTQTRAPLVLQHRRDSCRHPCAHTRAHANSTQHSVVTPHMSQISNKTTVAQHSQALRVSLLQIDLLKIGLLCLAGNKLLLCSATHIQLLCGSDAAPTL